MQSQWIALTKSTLGVLMAGINSSLKSGLKRALAAALGEDLRLQLILHRQRPYPLAAGSENRVTDCWRHWRHTGLANPA